MNKILIRIISFFILPAMVHADAVPDAGVFMNQAEQNIPQKSLPKIEILGETKTLFSGFQIYDGMTDSEALIASNILKPYVGKEIYISEMLDALQLELSQQNISVALKVDSENPSILHVLHPILGAIHIDNQSELKTDIIEKLLKNGGVTIGEHINQPLLEKNTSVLSEIPGIISGFSMQPGVNSGETDLNVTVNNNLKRYDGYFLLDNTGTTTLGEAVGGAGINFNNYLGRGESLKLNTQKQANGDFFQASSDVLVAPSGLRAGVKASTFTYGYSSTAVDATSGSTTITNFHGASSNIGIYLSCPLERSEFVRTNFTYNVDRKKSKSWYDAIATAPGQSTSTASAYLNNWTIDEIQIGLDKYRGFRDYSTLFYSGTLSYGNAIDEYPQNANQDGNFLKINASGIYTKPVFSRTDNTLFVGTTSMQLSSKNLPSNEKFFVGGFSYMKAFSPSIVGGDNAAYIEAKLQKNLINGGNIGAFFEAAYIQSNVTSYAALVGQNVVEFNDKSLLHDIGIIFNCTDDGLTLSASIAYRTSDLPTQYHTAINSTNSQVGPITAYIKLMLSF